MVTGNWRTISRPAIPIAALALALLAAQEPAPGASRLEGIWQGTLKAGTLELRLAFHVTQPRPGLLTATFDSLDQGATGLRVDAVSWDQQGAEVSFQLKQLGASFVGKLNAEGTQVQGEFKQGGAKLPLVLKRTEKLAELNRPQTPARAYPYEDVPIGIRNEAGGVTLTGTLTIPTGKGPFPAVVLISGSEAQDRDETILGHKPFLVLADHLTRRGVAVLRVDDRGVGGSSGKTMTSTSEDFAGDVLAEVAALKARPEIDAARIGLIGHSEGGLIAPLVAARSDAVAFIVLMAGPGLPGDEVLFRQGELLTRAMGGDDAALKRQQDVQRRTIAIARSELDPQAAADQIRAVLKESLAGLSEDEQKQARESGQLGEAAIQSVLSPWFRFFLAYDPRPTLAKVKCPVLALVGEKDLQVAPGENLEAIAKALREGGNPRYEVHELPGLNHLFQNCKSGSVSEYGKIEETIAPVALRAIGDWVVDQARRP